jgi:quercetin dioxygenase-like cupin family protein
MKRSALLVAAGAAAVATTVSGVAFATPGSGVLSAQVMARGAFVEQVDLKIKVKGTHGQDVINVKGAGDTVVQTISLAAGGHTGWHTHHGPVVVVVKSGTIAFVEGDCDSRTYSAGQTFVDPGQGHVHMARNTGTTTAELWVTYFDVPAGQSPRVDAAEPGCA